MILNVFVTNNALARQTKLELQQLVVVIDSVLAILVILLIVVAVINNVLAILVIVAVKVIVLVYLYVLGFVELMKQILNKINY